MKPLTIKEVSIKTGVSEWAVKKNVVDLLGVMPVGERVEVMEHMLYCKQLKNRRETIEPLERAL